MSAILHRVYRVWAAVHAIWADLITLNIDFDFQTQTKNCTKNMLTGKDVSVNNNFANTLQVNNKLSVL